MSYEAKIYERMLLLGIPLDAISQPELMAILAEIIKAENAILKDTRVAQEEYSLTLDDGVISYRLPRGTFTVDDVLTTTGESYSAYRVSPQEIITT